MEQETTEIQGSAPPRAVAELKDAVTDAFERLAQTGSVDRLRGYANEAIGETKLSIGLALSSPEIVLQGLAQQALGQAQRYIGEAKLAEEANIRDGVIPTDACSPPIGATDQGGAIQ
ncbi:hypothetical protein ACNHKD_08870 [Methylocystis sp. JAN1]|uniref:hypothetical protein n=1 Tax=Methylocystis sp. JAN1 TaxID=3397211 RepID=UPI003FA1F342